MASLKFVYGTMECGKTTKLLQDNYNYEKHGNKVVIIKPKIDTKGENTIVSRTNSRAKVDILLDINETIFQDEYLKQIIDAKAVLVDEAQFLSRDQIFDLWKVAHVLDIHVTCYGLKSDFRGTPFSGSTALFGFADQKTEMTVNCECGEIAVFNARRVDGKYQLEGNTVVIDGANPNVEYVPLCSECYLKYVVGETTVKKIKKKSKDLKNLQK